ncbi:hypothetical protein [Clostridium estertheticum]|nr:hypothetical protein [Clostridium estertheticum]
MDDGGIIEEIAFGSIKPHDMELSRDILLKRICRSNSLRST